MSSPQIPVDSADLHASYPYPTSFRPNIDFFVPLTFDAMPPPPPEPKLSKKAAKKAAKAAKKQGEIKNEGAESSSTEVHPKKGHGFGLKSSAQKFREKVKVLNNLENGSKKLAQEPDPVSYDFNASITIALMTRRELRELQEARKLVDKHDRKDAKKESKGMMR